MRGVDRGELAEVPHDLVGILLASDAPATLAVGPMSSWESHSFGLGNHSYVNMLSHALVQTEGERQRMERGFDFSAMPTLTL